MSTPQAVDGAAAAPGATLSGKFQVTEVEEAGDDSLFTPGDPSAPDAGREAFADQLANFMTLAQAGGNLDGPSTFQTSGAFQGDGGRYGLSWSGDFRLTPNADPAKAP